MSLSTHVLDAAMGRPAAGIAVRLIAGGGADTVAEALTDSDGRAALVPGDLAPGTYQLLFGTGAYFARTGTEAFYPEVTVTFEVRDAAAHHHVPLLLAPWAYSTYRGS